MTTAPSEKADKRKANRSFRRATRKDPEAGPMHVREVANVWSFAKDGKRYIPPTHPYFLRFGEKVMQK